MSYTWSKDSFIFIDSSYEREDSSGHEITSQKDVLLCFHKYQIIDPGPGKHRSLLLRKLFWSWRTLIGNQVYASDSTSCNVSVLPMFRSLAMIIIFSYFIIPIFHVIVVISSIHAFSPYLSSSNLFRHLMHFKFWNVCMWLVTCIFLYTT